MTNYIPSVEEIDEALSTPNAETTTVLHQRLAKSAKIRRLCAGIEENAKTEPILTAIAFGMYIGLVINLATHIMLEESGENPVQ